MTKDMYIIRHNAAYKIRLLAYQYSIIQAYSTAHRRNVAL